MPKTTVLGNKRSRSKLQVLLILRGWSTHPPPDWYLTIHKPEEGFSNYQSHTVMSVNPPAALRFKYQLLSLAFNVFIFGPYLPSQPQVEF